MHFILVHRILNIFYATKIKLLRDRSLLIGFFLGICVSQIYTFRYELRRLVPGIIYKKVLVDFDPIYIQYNLTIENRTLADKLYNDVKILCWVMTFPKNHRQKSKHVQRTWGKRCNKLLFMSSRPDKELDVIALPVHEGRENLWKKTKEAFKYIYTKHLNEYDWFLKADDDTYVVLENLRYMLYSYDKNSAIYFGCKFEPLARRTYASGGAGYVLSKESVRRFVEYSLTDPQYCNYTADGPEDKRMGNCLKSVGAIIGNSRDSNKHGKFFPFPPISHVAPYHASIKWYWNYIKMNPTVDCCSEYAISFHYVPPRDMYVLDYLIYHLKPFGIQIIEKLPDKINVTNPYQVELANNNIPTDDNITLS